MMIILTDNNDSNGDYDDNDHDSIIEILIFNDNNAITNLVMILVNIYMHSSYISFT